MSIDFFRRSALLINFEYLLLKIDSGFHSAKHFIAGAENTSKQIKFLVQQLMDTHLAEKLVHSSRWALVDEITKRLTVGAGATP